MTKTESRRRKVVMPFDIRKKFAAATAMLLVAVIMMVSSTYAWFTLSTAPEVKGIQTSVGANGNLEIALLNGSALFSNAADLGIITGIGDSMAIQGKDKKESNATWGNLIDLADEYGLDTVAFLPSALNIDGTVQDGYTIDGEYLLKAPRYGSDGRVIDVQRDTIIGKYQELNNGTGIVYPIASREDDGNGVGVIGIASGRTERMNAYQAAVSSALGYINAARNGAQNMLSTYGNDIASVFIKIASDSNQTTKFSKAEVQMLGTMITGLQTANNNVWLAIKQIALANALSAANTAELSDTDVTTLVAAVADPDVDTSAELSAITNMTAFTTELTAAIANYETTAGEIGDASNAYGNLGVDAAADDAEFDYAPVKALVNYMIDKQYVTIAGVQNPTSANKQELIDAATTGTAVPIILLEGSGALYDIAKSAGNYSASGITAEVDNNGLIVRPRVTISTAAEDPILLPTARNVAVDAGAPTNAAGGTGSIDSSYGYVIDFGFRTNAATGAKLLLQGNEELQRIYGDSTNESTKGEGTFVKFQSSDLSKFSLDDVVALVSALRIVFVEPVLTENQTTNETTVSYSVLTVAAPEIGVTVNADGSKTYDDSKVTKADENEDGTEDTVIVPIALYGYTVADAADGGKIVTLGDKKVDATDNTVNDLELLTLTQNVAQKLSAIVYLDGDAVDNTMVANAETSMTGTINFQFKTDAELVPMENPELRNGTNNSQNNTQTAYEKFAAALDTVIHKQAYIDALAASDNDPSTATEDQAALVLAVGQGSNITDSSTNQEILAAAAAIAQAYADVDPAGAAEIAAAFGVN